MEIRIRAPYLSPDSIRLLISAKDIAKQHGSWSVDSVHLLRVLIEDKSVVNVLKEQNINFDDINSGMDILDPISHFRSAVPPFGQKDPLTPLVVKILHMSATEAISNVSSVISPLDIFSSLVKQDEGGVAGVLKDYGRIDEDKRQKILVSIQRRRRLIFSTNLN